MKRSFIVILLLFLAFLLTPGVALAQTPEPLEPMPQVTDRLAPPPTVYPPTQADEGAQIYYMVCMACHGDQGQGLSPEWVEAWELGEESCWQSKCHASNHPPEGFKLPEYIPAVVSPGTVDRFANAQELHDYLQEKMPWQAPGTLTAEEYWQLTAYLVRANGIDPGIQTLNEHTAAKVLLRSLPPGQEPGPVASGEIPGYWIAAILILVAAGIIFLVKYIQILIKPRRPDDEFH
jgi:cytochrome c5